MFFKELRGSFSGIYYDKIKNKKIIFTDHTARKPVYYTELNEKFIIASDVNIIVNNLNKKEYSLNIDSAWSLLTFSYILDENTMFNEIKRLSPGCCMCIDGNEIDIIQYHKFENTDLTNETDLEIIENVDKLFRQAVKRAFDKDEEYGYKHLASLSGGLDSRMVNWVAEDMGYGDSIVNLTFSQTDYLDETIPKTIARDLKRDWIFKSLDNGPFLKSIEEAVKSVAGQYVYTNIVHEKSMLDLINKQGFGIFHTGGFGDEIMGSELIYREENKLTDKVIAALMYTPVPYNIKIDRNKYPNEEIFRLYNSGLLRTPAIGEDIEVFSPFLGVEFLEYCLRIPSEKRMEHKMYIKWILSKYPEAANYDWERIHTSIRNIKTSEDYRRALKNVKRSSDSKDDMNPLEYWYRTNNDLKQYLDNYYNDNINRLKFDKDLFEDCVKRYEKGNMIGKTKVLTLLAFMKIYFD